MVSHLRKMTLLSRISGDGATTEWSVSPLIPLSTGEAVQNQDASAVQYHASAGARWLACASFAKIMPCTIKYIGTSTVGISDHGSICTASEPCPA
jgi:hypothetical protein